VNRDVCFVTQKLAISNSLSADSVPQLNLSVVSHGHGRMIGELLSDFAGISGVSLEAIMAIASAWTSAARLN
jgi:hypothetical protein